MTRIKKIRNRHAGARGKAISSGNFFSARGDRQFDVTSKMQNVMSNHLLHQKTLF
jgi:hypothetical protein